MRTATADPVKRRPPPAARVRPATRYTDVRRASRPAAVQPSGPGVFVPRLGRDIPFEEWYWRELREGGLLQRYIATEKWRSRDRLRAVARREHRLNQVRGEVNGNRRSEFRQIAALPAREYFRWLREDPHFFADRSNLRSFRRDNPDACITL